MCMLATKVIRLKKTELGYTCDFFLTVFKRSKRSFKTISNRA